MPSATVFQRSVKNILLRVPGGPRVRRLYWGWREKWIWEDHSPAKVFRRIYSAGYWGGGESASGRGSSLAATTAIRGALPSLLRTYQVGSMLDIPCGDYHWMRSVDLGEIRYCGADIVTKIVKANKSFSDNTHRFEVLDVITDELPRVALVFVRDCFVHLPNASVLEALRNICASGSSYLLATTFPGRSGNAAVTVGKWRPINLQGAPFNLPQPVEMLREESREAGTEGKAMALWRLSVISERLGSC